MGMMAAAVLSQSRGQGGEVKGGGVVMIGPIPIVFGSDAKWASAAIFLAIVLILVSLVATVI
ncbi:MAG: DUF131 domain-containing protein [Nitrososphaerota archaeon]|nr:DUF131 domain-containing protein [Nitrososphaerota archaeon]